MPAICPPESPDDFDFDLLEDVAVAVEVVSATDTLKQRTSVVKSASGMYVISAQA